MLGVGGIGGKVGCGRGTGRAVHSPPHALFLRGAGCVYRNHRFVPIRCNEESPATFLTW